MVRIAQSLTWVREVYRFLPVGGAMAYCLLSVAYCLLSVVYCLLSVVYCLLSVAYCLLSVAAAVM